MKSFTALTNLGSFRCSLICSHISLDFFIDKNRLYQYLNFSKNRSLTSAEIRSEYLKHSLVINENNYLTYYTGNLTLNTSINPSKWYHAAGTFEDDGSAELFLDGISVESSSNGPKLKSNLYKAWIGSWNGVFGETFSEKGSFNGTIDNVAIYSRALTNQTVKSHFERGLKTYSLQRLRTTSTKEQWNNTIMTNLRIVG